MSTGDAHLHGARRENDCAPGRASSIPAGDSTAKVKRPVSARRLEANRRNALKSTGPRTAAGKARSARNSRKHGY